MDWDGYRAIALSRNWSAGLRPGKLRRRIKTPGRRPALRGALALDWICHQHLLLGNIRPAPSDETLDRIDRFRRFDNARAAGGMTHDRLHIRPREVDNRRGEPPPFRIGDH